MDMTRKQNKLKLIVKVFQKNLLKSCSQNKKNKIMYSSKINLF